MIRTERHGDVVRLQFSSKRSRIVGYSVSAYLIRGVLIDSAFPAAEHDLLQAVRPSHVHGVLISHQHEDHAGNVEALAQLGIPMGMAEATRRAVSDPPDVRFYRRWTWGVMRPLRTALTPFTPNDFSLIPTPGHSGDHHVIWDNTSDTVFGGDLFLGVKVKVAHPGEDIRGTVLSLRRVIAMKPRRFFDGHRGLVPDAVQSLIAKADWMEATIGRIDTLLRDGAEEPEILKRVLGADGFTGYFSGNDYSHRNFIRSVMTTAPTPGDDGAR